MKTIIIGLQATFVIVLLSLNTFSQLSFKSLDNFEHSFEYSQLNPPQAEFTASRTVLPALSSVTFTSTSIGEVTSYQWSFPGGNPSTSTVASPGVFYSTPGTYSVTLTVTNSFGQDTETKLDFIVVNPTFSMCSNTSSNSDNGTLYDSGGPSSNYTNNQNCNFLISPACADSIVLNIVSFATEQGYDFLTIYDGPNSTFPILFSQSGTISSTIVRGSNSSMFMIWNSDVSQAGQGFQINWSTIAVGSEPIEPILFSNTSTAIYNIPVSFSNNTTAPYLSTAWDFGDGSTATGNNTIHTFLSNGVFEVQMEVFVCGTSFIGSQIITVSGAPEIDVISESIELTLQCGTDTTITLDVSNIGESNLNWRLTEADSLNSHLTILALTSGTDIGMEFANTLAAIASELTNYSVITTSSTNANTISALMENADVVLFPENESISLTLYNNVATLIQSFVSNGGVVIQCHPSFSQVTVLDLFDIFNSTTETPEVNTSFLLSNPADPISNGLTLPVIGPSSTRSYRITNPNYVSLLYPTSANGTQRTMAGYRQIGQGRAYLLGTDFTTTNSNITRLLANMLNSARSAESLDWITIETASGQIGAQSTQQIQLSISALDLLSGEYQGYLILDSNDDDEYPIEIPIALNVVGQGEFRTLNECLDMGEVPVNSFETRGIWLYNDGCAEINISSIIFENENFEAYPNGNIILPQDSLYVTIGGLVDSEGEFDTFAEVISNLNTFSFCLQGNGVLAGGFVLNADSVYLQLNTCGDTQSIQVLATNYLAEPVNVSISELPSPIEVIEIGVLLNGVDVFNGWWNILDFLENLPESNYNLSVTYASTESAISEFVQGKDIIIIPEIETSPLSYNFILNPILDDFTLAGGRVILFSQSQGNLASQNSLGLFSVTGDEFVFGDIQVNTESDFSVGLPEEFASSPFTVAIEATNPGIQPIATVGSSYVACYRDNGLGRIFYFGFTYLNFSEFSDILLRNIINDAPIDYQGNITFNSDLALNEGESTAIEFTISSDNLSNGRYIIPFGFQVNDELSFVDTVFVVVDVQGAPCADFEYIQSCQNTLNFLNTSLNDVTSVVWDFGDGVQDTELNSSHSYSQGGTYEVSLTACNDFGCDTRIETIDVITISQPIPPICITNNVNSLYEYGIWKVNFGSISNTSQGGVDDYQDYSCVYLTDVVAGDNLPFVIETFNSERLKFWIDFDNNGEFNDDTELIYQNSSLENIHSGVAFIPFDAVLNTPLRARITSDAFLIPGACSNPANGQTEDYAVRILPVSGPPVADFFANPQTGFIGQTMNFINATTGGATTYQWIFESANSPESNDINPTNIYSQIGVYDVTLIASNEFGSDTITKPDYITITNTVNLCSGITTTTMPSGVLYDSGGEFGDYTANESCTFLIQPFCAESIFLNVNFFISEGCCDLLEIYDGDSQNAPLIATINGGAPLMTIEATSGSVFIVWTTDWSVEFPGFEVSWTSTLLTQGDVVSDFTISNSTPALFEDVDFSNMSNANADEFLWDFGDGSISTEFSPSHFYSIPGMYSVSLIANNCFESDTVTYRVFVQEAPVFEVNGAEVNYITGCFNQENASIILSNNGDGELNWSLEPIMDGPVRVLMLTHGTNPNIGNENLLEALYSIPTNILLDQSSLSNATLIEQIIYDYDVVLLPELTQNINFYSIISSLLVDFAEQGGTIIKCAPRSTADITNTGLFTGQHLGSTSSGQLFANTSNELTAFFPTFFSAVATTYYANITNADFVSLITFNGNDVYGYRQIGAGRAYLIGYDFFVQNSNASSILVRSVEVNNGFVATTLPEWLTIEQSNGTIEPGESAEFAFSLDITGLPSGVYNTAVPIYTNDPLNGKEFVFINLYLDVSPCPSFAVTSSCSGATTLQNTSINYNSVTWTIEGQGVYEGEFVELDLPGEGIYEVVMEVCNSILCVTDTQYVTISQSSIIEDFSCIPAAPSSCCNSVLNSLYSISGIHENTFLINNQSHYSNFTCSDLIYLQENAFSTFELEFGVNSSYIIYIDYNNDLAFSDDELLTSGFSNFLNYEFILPADAISGELLRMRIILDDNASQLNPCTIPNGGSAYDFVVFIIGEDLLPIALFNVVEGGCSQQRGFVNNSVNASSYTWNFGDGNTSSDANPVHEYAASGVYEVTLTAINEWGQAQTTQTLEVEVIEDNISTFGQLFVSTPIQFALSGTYDSYFWETSDGQASNAPSPIFSFDAIDIFSITATVSIGDCELTFLYEFDLLPLNVEDFGNSIVSVLYPNPTNNTAYLELSNFTGETPVVELLDVTGRLIGPCRKISEGEGMLKYIIEPSVNGVYLIRIISGEASRTLRLVVNK